MTTLADFDDTLARLNNLRGLSSDVLKAAGFDRLLDELAAEAQAVATLRQHNQALMETEEALGLVLVMLTYVDENPPVQLRGSALRNLLEPLHKKLATVTDEMNGVLF